ncbi:hypothetical protein M409DRAFT_49781 [Zasmidium cellare ATCC 36951]|uniref:Bacteriophage T5 Orf172 DNA-binding domain-containing protein n=1 Tax=Zasmidium cellare ATCC 36951 TaxID=1080233 RepID=A0A6A6D4H4_ZASCE|nr:uncharacterized protein M409DRAFT_49781 [Zasmidium cellare ATCC 36951]KAF2173318.1 hypothetical protein M409DRAFT_49781 [Zasmidium cellare ATCC 36951]
MAKVKLVLFEDKKACLARTTNGRTCLKSVRPSDRISATRLIHKFTGDEGSYDETGLDLKILSLLICGTHQDKISDDFPSHVLLVEYRTKFKQWAGEHEPLPAIHLRRSDAGSRTCTGNKLRQPIAKGESEIGIVYLFTCEDLPEMVNIGFEGDLSAMGRRVKKWGMCHAKPKAAFYRETCFRHRVEELVHRQLSCQRYDVSCPVTKCKSEYHNEWFKCSVEEASIIIDQWVTLMNECTLYDHSSRKLDPAWQNEVRLVANAQEEVTAQRLLTTVQIDGLANAFTATSLEDN